MREDIINDLINDMKEELSYFLNKSEFDKYLITIRNNLNKDDYVGFLKDLYVEDYTLQVVVDNNFENIIGMDVYLTKDINYFYRITFTEYEEMLDYCTCVPEDEGYDPRYNCCGEYCEWLRPGFNLSKIVVIGSEKYKGLERDLWKELDEFRKITDEDKKQIAIEKEIEELNTQIKELQEKLFKLKGEM